MNTTNKNLHNLTSESINENSSNIDKVSTKDMLKIINNEDKFVALAVEREIANIAIAVDKVYEALKNGGHLIYVGAGTSGRLGVLDASECPPTYGTPKELVQGFIAGGDTALRNAIEGAEDDYEGGKKLIEEIKVTSKDVVMGITASGSAKFVIGAIDKANEIGCFTIGLTNNKESNLKQSVKHYIAPIVGPEVIIGSTRMKSGTSQKLVLNMITTAAMIKLGKVYDNLMVDLRATNVKLVDRAKRIVSKATGMAYEETEKFLTEAEGHAKTAILMIKAGVDAKTAKETLTKCSDKLSEAIETLKK